MKYRNIPVKLPYYCQAWFVALLFLLTPLTLTLSFIPACYFLYKRYKAIQAEWGRIDQLYSDTPTNKHN